MKLVLPEVCTRYKIQNPVYELPYIRHCTVVILKYCFRNPIYDGLGS